MLYAIIAVLVILADQLIKLYVSTDGFQPIQLIPGVLNLTKVENTGGAFGLLGGEIPTYWFIIIAGVFTVLVVIALATRFINGWLARWSIVLVTAGGISNCIDRVINVRPTGHVVDMFQFAFWKSFPVFNLADIFISVFCIVFILAILFGRDQKDQGSEDDEFVEDTEEEARGGRRGDPSRPQGPQGRKDERTRKRNWKKRKSVPPRPPHAAARPASPSMTRSTSSTRPPSAPGKKPNRLPPPRRWNLPPPRPRSPQNPAYDPADPFAEWERANAARKSEPVFVPAAPAEVVEEPVRPIRRSELKAEPKPAAPVEPEQPAVPETPVARPARKPAPAPVVEEPSSFDLDDILAEFK